MDLFSYNFSVAYVGEKKTNILGLGLTGIEDAPFLVEITITETPPTTLKLTCTKAMPHSLELIFTVAAPLPNLD